MSIHFRSASVRIISADDGSVILENPINAQLQSVLGAGQVVTVRGTRIDDSSSVATGIRFDDELVGEITAVSAADGSSIVLVQAVSVTPDTTIDDSNKGHREIILI